MRFHVLGLKCIECGSYNTSREGEEGVPVAQPDEGDEWETEEEEEILGGEEADQRNEDESPGHAEANDNAEGLNIAEVLLNLDGESNNVLPLD